MNSAITQEDIATAYLPITAAPGDDHVGTVTGGNDWFDFFIRPDNFDSEFLDAINTALNEFYDQVRKTFFNLHALLGQSGIVGWFQVAFCSVFNVCVMFSFECFAGARLGLKKFCVYACAHTYVHYSCIEPPYSFRGFCLAFCLSASLLFYHSVCRFEPQCLYT